MAICVYSGGRPSKINQITSKPRNEITLFYAHNEFYDRKQHFFYVHTLHEPAEYKLTEMMPILNEKKKWMNAKGDADTLVMIMITILTFFPSQNLFASFQELWTKKWFCNFILFIPLLPP